MSLLLGKANSKVDECYSYSYGHCKHPFGLGIFIQQLCPQEPANPPSEKKAVVLVIREALRDPINLGCILNYIFQTGGLRAANLHQVSEGPTYQSSLQLERRLTEFRKQ